MKNCYDCNHCEMCKWIDEFKDKDVCDFYEQGQNREPSGDTVSLEVFKQVMRERDIAIEQLHELGYELGQKIEPSGDLISRQAVDELSKALVHTTRDKADFLCNFWEGLQKLSSVNPQKSGHWIEVDNGYICSECDIIRAKGTTGKYNYCPNCGAKMVEPQESEE